MGVFTLLPHLVSVYRDGGQERSRKRMIIKELYRKIGIELDVHNLIVDYTLSDGRRAHNAYQIIENQVKVTDADLIQGVRNQIPEGSRICMITEVKGDYELTELSDIADSVELLAVDKRMIYLDRKLAQEYVNEIRRGEL